MIQSFKTIIPVAVGVLTLVVYGYLSAQAPANPPGNNVDAPLNTSGTYQAKLGNIGAVAFRGGQYCSADGTNCAVSVLTASDVTDLLLQSAAPTIEFNDSDSSASSTDFWLHNNSNNFYILADRDDNGSWEGNHPLQITVGATSASDAITFSNQVRAISYCERDGSDCFTGADITALSTPIDTSSFLTTAAGLQTKLGSLTVNGNITGGNLFTDGQLRANNFCDAAGGNCTLPANILDTTATNQTKAGNLTAPIFIAQTQVRSDSYCSEAGGNCFAKIQSGNAAVPLSDGSPTIGSFNVTFPTAFANVPVVTFTPRWVRYTGDEPTSWWVTNITTTGFTINWKVPGGGTSIGQSGVQWIAID